MSTPITAREFFAGIPANTPPYIPELHQDDCEDTTCTRCVDRAPLTTEREQEIRTRRQGITDGPWGSYRDLKDQYVVEANPRLIAHQGFVNDGEIAHIVATTDEQGHRRADFITRAPSDIDTLLAELDRVRTELETLQRKYTFDTADLKRERDGLQRRLHDAAMTKTWTNEDGKKFVFVEDIAPALLGTNPRA